MTTSNLPADFDLLDGTLDDLADLKKFEPNPVGSYRMGIAWETPANDEFVVVQLKLNTLECIEVPNVAEENLPPVGKVATFSMRLQRVDKQPMVWEKDGTPNDQDQGRFKEILLALAPVFNPDGSLSNRGMMEASEGAEVYVTLGVRASKKDPDAKFNFIKAIALVE